MSETLLTPEVDNQQTAAAAAAPAAPVAETPVVQVTEQPAAPADWRNSLPEDLRGEKMFENIKGKDAAEVLPVLAKGYRDAQKLVGNSMGKLPGKDAKPEEVAAWKEANLPKLREAGVLDAAPADPTKYTAKVIKDGAPVDLPPGALDGFYKEAHALGLTDKQAQGMLDLYTKQQTEMGGSAKQTMDLLQKEYGAGVQNQIRLAQRAVQQVGGSELIDVLETTGLGNHPALIKAFAKVGNILSEDDAVFADTVKTGVDDARSQRAKIMNDRGGPYWNRDHPDHNDAVAQVARLNQVIFAQES